MTAPHFNRISSKPGPSAPEEKLFGYHVHIYFETGKASEKTARETLAKLDELFPDALAGVHRVGIVGPHPQPNFGSFMEAEDFGRVVGWLQRHSEGLSILVHPITGDDLKDHRNSALWLGKPVPLNLAALTFDGGNAAGPADPAPKGPTRH